MLRLKGAFCISIMDKDRLFFIVFGIFLVGLSIYVWIQPTWAIPTRSGDKMIHFVGLAKFLFGFSPFLGGLGMFRNSTMPKVRKEHLIMTLFISGVFSMILSILLSQKY